jgi:hypothetical protein
MMSSVWQHRWLVIKTIQDRVNRVTFYQIGIYVTIMITLILSALTLHNSLRFTEKNIVFVARQPLFLPILVNTGLVSLYLGVIAAVNVSRERDRRTLEVLLYGPVDEMSFLSGIFIAQIRMFFIAMAFTFIWSHLGIWILNLAFSIEIYLLFLTSFLMSSVVISFGLFTAVWGDKTRTALVFFIMILLLLAGVQIADQVVSNIVISNNPSSNDPILLLRNALASISRVIQWFSPYSQFLQSMDAIADRNLVGLMKNVGVMLLQTFVLIFVSIKLLEHKGARE